MIKTLLLIGICLVASIFYACQKTSDIQSLSPDKFEELTKDRRVQLVDVRTMAEFTEGHLAGAININVMADDQFSKAVQQLLSKEAPVAVYCKGGRRSKKAAKELIKAGFQVYDLDGGIEEWKEAGKTIVK